VIVSRTTASVPNCPNYDRERGPSSTSSNYGCGVNSNLAAMIANPDDLIVGQDGSGTDSAGTAGRAIRIYRDRTPTGTQPLPSTTTSSRGNQ